MEKEQERTSQENRNGAGSGEPFRVVEVAAGKPTVKEAVVAYNALTEIASRRIKDYKLAMAIQMQMRKLEPLHDAYQQERNKLVEEYALEDDEGNPIMRPDGNGAMVDTFPFEKAHRQLFNTPADVRMDGQFSPEQFKPLIEKEGLEPVLLSRLGRLLEMEE